MTIQIEYKRRIDENWEQGILLETVSTGSNCGIYFVILRRKDLSIDGYWSGDVEVRYNDVVGTGFFREGR